MTSLDYVIVGSGSTGNCVRIGRVMVDCGVPFSKLEKEIGKVDVLLITHIHGDHIKRSTFNAIRRLYPNIRIAANYHVAQDYAVDKIVHDMPFTLKGITFIPFDGEHDVPVTGYEWEYGDNRIIYATDTNTMANAPRIKYDYLFVESNHDEQKLDQMRAKHGYDPKMGAVRHLSTQQCKYFYYANRKSRESKLIELHKSERFY